MRWLVSSIVAVGLLAGAWFEVRQIRAWFLRESAERAYYRGEIHEALALYERVRRLVPHRPSAYTEPADSISQYLRSEQAQSLTVAEFEELVVRTARLYLMAIREGPPGAWSYAGLGTLAGAMRTARVRREGIDLSALAADPADLLPEDRLGEAAWVKAVQLEPRNFYYRDFLGDFYLRRGFDDRALAHFRDAVRLHPVLDRHYYLSYFASVSPAVLSAVEEGIHQALEWEETEVSEYDIHRFLAEVYLRLGRSQEARASFEAAAEVAPIPQAIDVRIGQILAMEGDDEGALAAFRRALERQPDYVRALLHMGLALSRLGRHDEAVEAALQARGLEPADLRTLSAVARVLRSAGREAAAAEVLETLILTHPDRQQPYLQLIRIYEGQGQLADAVRIARRLADRYPEEPIFREQVEQLQQAALSDR